MIPSDPAAAPALVRTPEGVFDLGPGTQRHLLLGEDGRRYLMLYRVDGIRILARQATV